MTVLIPVNEKDQNSSHIVSMNENHTWAFITIDEGRIVSCDFFDDRNEIVGWIDSIVVINEQEHVWPFMDEGMIVLTAPTQRTIEDIIEAFLFKELYDFSV